MKTKINHSFTVSKAEVAETVSTSILVTPTQDYTMDVFSLGSSMKRIQ